jgi:hypothetical protein
MTKLDLLILACAFNFYCIGASCVERFVNYQTWLLLGTLLDQEGFKAYHRAQEPLIQASIVFPLLISFVFQLLLLVLCPHEVDIAWVWVMMLATLMGFISTLLIQLPVHFKFNKDGYSESLMLRLLNSDWIRKACDVIKAVASLTLLHQFAWR